ncbi:MAG: hypothetical protein K2X03_07825 [Bryobacteraceae bacterium]|nr:hypothetical protein [Bryobacteraceae bacterium]
MTLSSSLILGVHIVMAMLLAGGALAVLFSGGTTSPALPRQTAVIGIILLLTTGINNFISRLGTGVPKGYHMWFGIKFLLALHVVTMIYLVSGGKLSDEKRIRLLKGAGASVIAVVLISVYLNFLATRG